MRIEQREGGGLRQRRGPATARRGSPRGGLQRAGGGSATARAGRRRHSRRNSAPATVSAGASARQLDPAPGAMPVTPTPTSTRVGQRAEARSTGHTMLAPQALAQHEGVLRADGDDQAQRQHEAGGECAGSQGGHAPDDWRGAHNQSS